MKLSISNIAWSSEHDKNMYCFLQKQGFTGLEIAPTRIFPKEPYEHIEEARDWSAKLKENFGISIPSIQSIWYNRTENIFRSKKDRAFLIEYTKKAVNFAHAIGCKNIVFGNPKNRNTEYYHEDINIAVDFFRELGNFALEHDTVIAIEPNPVIYNTNFMNNISETIEVIYKVQNKGIKLNLDLGSIIFNNETLDFIHEIPNLINHVHISEPGLDIIKSRDIHTQLLSILEQIHYDHFVSIEMGNKGDLNKVKEAVLYVKGLN